MALVEVTRFGGVNTYINPLEQPDGAVFHCLNMESNPYGGKQRRTGYASFLGTPDNSRINSLFSWRQDVDSTFFLYRASGSSLYYSAQGTGAWTICGNGTIGNGSPVVHAVLDNTMVIADGIGSTRYTTNGTSFTDITTAPPAVQALEMYHNRIYAAGTGSFDFYSTTGTASDWTSDSSSIAIPGEGRILTHYKAGDRLIATKTTGLMYRWDEDTLVDMATRMGPSSAQSVAEVEGSRFWLNRNGIFLSNGGAPQLVSNAIQRQIYNNAQTGIPGTSFGTAPGGVYRYDYYVAVGTTTDDYTGIQIPDNIIRYNYQKNEFYNAQFAHAPTAFANYRDTTGLEQFIFGDSSGQCYQLGTYSSDNGSPIQSSLLIMLHGGKPFRDKEWKHLLVYSNPGNSAKVQFAVSSTPHIFTPFGRPEGLIWRELGDINTGYTILPFPPESRGALLFVRFYDASTTSQFSLYGLGHEFDLLPQH